MRVFQYEKCRAESRARVGKKPGEYSYRYGEEGQSLTGGRGISAQRRVQKIPERRAGHSDRRPPPTKMVKFSVLSSNGPKVDLTNEQIYEHIEFP